MGSYRTNWHLRHDGKQYPPGATVELSDQVARSLPEGLLERASGRQAQAERSETPDESWTVAQLREYAGENGIELGNARSKADILAAIEAAGQADEGGEDDDAGEDDEE